MKSKKTTRRALFSSVMALILCCAMLVGSTFAWFTDSVSSTNNIIKSGNLDVGLEYSKDFGTWTEVKSDTNVFDTTLWEPGHVEVVYLKVSNLGTLALKYRLGVNVASEVSGTNVENKTFNLSDYIMFGVVDATAKFADRDAAVAAVTAGATELKNVYSSDVTSLAAKNDAGTDDEKTVALVVYMPTTVGNEANYKTGTTAPSINLGLNVYATQVEAESDSFGNNYDTAAPLPGSGAATLNPGQSAVEIEIRDENDTKVGSAVVPAGAIDPAANKVEITIDASEYEANISVTANQETTAFDVTVTGLVAGNTEPVKVSLRIAAGLDPATVKLYHYDTLIDSTYDPNTGYVTFESATFSPFTVVYDAESTYVPPTPDPEVGSPAAKVTYKSEYVNVDLPWENYSGWAPTPGLDSKLEAAFEFECPAEIDPAYEYWYCDFFVSLDKDLGENEIFLGGNYGDFGWVGFHNGELTLAANTELPLLCSVTTNPWTYSDVENLVGAFLCGVGDVGDALEKKEATFTVKLRLINPEKVDTTKEEWWVDMPADAYIDTNVVTYTFGGNYVIK